MVINFQFTSDERDYDSLTVANSFASSKVLVQGESHYRIPTLGKLGHTGSIKIAYEQPFLHSRFLLKQVFSNRFLFFDSIFSYIITSFFQYV